MNIPQQIPLTLDFRTAYGRDDFFIGASNQEAVAVIDKWPDWGRSPFLIIQGEEGSGKRHLASVWKSKSDSVVINAQDFANLDLMRLRVQNKNLIIHQLHLLIGDQENEEKLFHLYQDYFNSQKAHVLFTSRIQPADLNFILPDLKSRLTASILLRIRAPDEELLAQVLTKQLYDKGLNPSPDLIKYAVSIMERSWFGAKKLSEALHQTALTEKRPLSKRMIQTALMHVESQNVK